MDYEKLARDRRSVRGYRPNPIPHPVMDEIIDVATRAPSSMNTQPWHFHVISGEALERIRAGNTERMMAAVMRGLVAGGCIKLRAHNISREHVSFIIADLWRFRGLVLGGTPEEVHAKPDGRWAGLAQQERHLAVVLDGPTAQAVRGHLVRAREALALIPTLREDSKP